MLELLGEKYLSSSLPSPPHPSFQRWCAVLILVRTGLIFSSSQERAWLGVILYHLTPLLGAWEWESLSVLGRRISLCSAHSG